ncbi:hypothetical protein N9344_00330 [bacterium]|nr:hypothetical protein [bacterium]
MTFILSFIILIFLTVLTYQDFKSRSINWVLIPILFLAFVVKGFLEISYQELFNHFVVNILIVIVNLLGVTILISLKEKKFTNIIDTQLGLGDVLFFVVLAVAFSPINFLIFYLGSVFITTLIYGIIMLKNKEQTFIPLAGAMSIMLAFMLIIEQTTRLNFYRSYGFEF